jgi:CRISPR locus-related DNA-binding protein
MKNVQVALVGEQPGGAIQGLRVPPPFDHLVLLHSDSEKSQKAAHEVRGVAERMVSPGEIELVKIDPFGMSDVLGQVTLVRKRHPDATITVNLSGGTNIMASAALLGCFILGADAIYIKMPKGEIPGPLEDRLVRLPVPRVVLEDVKGSKLRILESLLGPRGAATSKTQGEIGRDLEMSAQLVSAHLKKLGQWKLVTIRTEGRTKVVGLTDSGRLFAQLAA